MAIKKRILSDIQMEWKTHLPGSYKKNYEKAISTNSLKEAIKAKCLDCMNWDKKELSECPTTFCPLHPHRPYQTHLQDAKCLRPKRDKMS